jgi:glycosyltransferase 2 family protein
MEKQTGSLLLKIIGSVAIIAFLFTRIDWDIQRFQIIFQNVKLKWFLISLSGVIIVLLLKSVRWNLLLRFEECIYPYFAAFGAYMASFTIGVLTPGRLGEIARLYYVRAERNISFYRSFKTIVTDRMFDFALLFWFGTSGLLFFYKVFGDFHSIWYLMITGLGFFLLWLTGTFILKGIHCNKPYYTFIEEAWTEMFIKRMTVPWLLTLVSYFLFYAANWFIFLALGQRVSIIEIGFILSIMSLITLIPITIAGFGTREASLIYLFSFYGLGPEIAIVFSLFQFIAFMLWGGIIGWIFWLIKPVSIALIRQDAGKLVTMLKRKKSD